MSGRRTTIPRTAALGLLLGAAWGVLARIWMRLITEEPEFSWTGTLMIIGLAALLGGGVGVAHAARRQGRRAWWTLAVVPGLVLFMSPGMLLAPALLVGGLARTGRRGLVRAVGWVGIIGPVLAMLFFTIGVPEPGSELDLGGTAVALGGFTLMVLSLAWASSLLWQRRAVRDTAPSQHEEVAVRVV